LLGVKVANWFPSLAFLEKADAMAALGVAIIVVVVSLKLGLRTIEALMDTAPAGMAEKIKAAVEAIKTVADCHAIRVRQSGPHYFVDLHVTLDGGQTLHAAHELTEQVEQAVQTILPGADVTVHPEPLSAATDPSARSETPHGGGSPGNMS
jgi:divalent metal cation (Fe/Co/Zn/Cd) transporter